MSLFQVLQASAADHPARPALVVDGDTLSYRDLLDLVLQAAAGLRARGIGRGARVALWAPRRLETYVAVHATLALGAAYAPIDVTAPAARAVWMAENARAEVLFCRAFDAGQLPLEPPPSSLRLLVLLDGGAPAPLPVPAVSWDDLLASGNGTAGKAAETSDGDLAYILYTSGSTSAPKAVAISHGAARAFVDWAGDLCELSPADRVANSTSLSFDLSVFDLFSTARAGAALVAVPAWLTGQGHPFVRFLAEQRISVWYSVPTLLARIAENQESRPRDLGSLRLAVFAGEVFPKPKLLSLHGVLPQTRLLNWYGPTETNVCTSHEVGPADLEDEEPLPIGLPCPYAEVVIERGDDGLAGELLVGGRSLMEGYWRGGGIDSSVFRDLPGRSGRFYPTGDLASFRPDGSLLFHGRRDSQVKLLGYRIELGEIEEALAGCPGVQEAAVVLSGSSLFAFVTTGAAAPFYEEEARGHLGRLLPTYMIPQRIRALPALPRTERGKIDRQSLLRSLGESTSEPPHG